MNMTMIIFGIDGKIGSRKCLCGIGLVGLPLRGLLPEPVAAGSAVAVTKSMSAFQICKYLILKTVPDLVCNHGTYRLTSRRINPQCPYCIVVTAAIRHPFCRIMHKNHHFVFIQIGSVHFAFCKLQRADVQCVELFGLGQKIINIDAIFFRYGVRIGIVLPITCTPEHNKMLRLTAPRIGPFAPFIVIIHTFKFLWLINLQRICSHSNGRRGDLFLDRKRYFFFAASLRKENKC